MLTSGAGGGGSPRNEEPEARLRASGASRKLPRAWSRAGTGPASLSLTGSLAAVMRTGSVSTGRKRNELEVTATTRRRGDGGLGRAGGEKRPQRTAGREGGADHISQRAGHSDGEQSRAAPRLRPEAAAPRAGAGCRLSRSEGTRP